MVFTCSSTVHQPTLNIRTHYHHNTPTGHTTDHTTSIPNSGCPGHTPVLSNIHHAIIIPKSRLQQVLASRHVLPTRVCLHAREAPRP